MPEFRYTVVEHEPARPWIIVGDTRHLTVELARTADFASWATEHWPQDRYTAVLEPAQEERRLKF